MPYVGMKTRLGTRATAVAEGGTVNSPEPGKIRSLVHRLEGELKIADETLRVLEREGLDPDAATRARAHIRETLLEIPGVDLETWEGRKALRWVRGE